jgi:lipoprotein-anchoring transpeptidase ErfK/SrfK
MYVRSFNVGLGQHGSTPTGTWMVAPQGKLKNPKWWGTPDEPAKEAGDPLNPLGKFWIGLNGTDGDAVGKEGFGIHGTIDPASIGKEMSHGCIRLVNENVEWVYQMLVDGKSTIIVKD